MDTWPILLQRAGLPWIMLTTRPTVYSFQLITLLWNYCCIWKFKLDKDVKHEMLFLLNSSDKCQLWGTRWKNQGRGCCWSWRGSHHVKLHIDVTFFVFCISVSIPSAGIRKGKHSVYHNLRLQQAWKHSENAKWGTRRSSIPTSMPQASWSLRFIHSVGPCFFFFWVVLSY